jgi:bacteriorhodopsin
VPLAETTPGVRTFLLCFCIMCTCQALYQLYHTVPADDSIRARRASWDFVAVPLVEAFVYGLMSSNAAVGYVRLFDGRAVYWLRTVGWLLTVPVLLLQIGKMSKFRVRGLDVNNIIVWLGIFMVICGFSASLSSNDGLKWMFFILGLVSLLTIYVAAYFIMIAAGNFYVALDSEEGLLIAHRIRIMMFIFFFSWSLYPLFFLLSIEGACVVSENVTVVCFTLLDCLTKNIFGLVLWDTLWNRTLGGRWTSNAEAMAAEMDVLPLHEDAENSMNEGQMVPYADENGEKHVEADVVVRPGTPARRSIAGSKMRSPMPVPAAAHSMPASKIRSNAGGQSPYPVAPVEVLPPYFNSLGPNTGQNFVEADLDPLHTGLPVKIR